MKSIAIFELFFIIFSFFPFLAFAPKASAANPSFSSAKDVISTSRPSSSTPLTEDVSSSASTVTVFNNGSRFLASDSATLVKNTGAQTAVTVASQSADLTSVYFTKAIATAQNGSVTLLEVPITAKHTFTVVPATTIPANGSIKITFPGSGDSSASPSASTFAFNNLTAGNTSVSGSGWTGSTCTTISAPTIACTTSSQVNAGSPITIIIGSSTPALINPVKSPTSTAGQSGVSGKDIWNVNIQSFDGSAGTGNLLDQSTVLVNDVESTVVSASVDPILTFIIAGVAPNTSVCSDTTTSGITASTATTVDLGSLSSAINISAQTLTVTTNSPAGYAITATTSGKLLNAASGYAINDANGGIGLLSNTTPAPAAITAGNPAFGIHPCGTNVVGSPSWGSGTTGSGNAKYANPWNSAGNAFSMTLTSASSPVTNDTTTVEYGATINGNVPAGSYSTVITYVATAQF